MLFVITFLIIMIVEALTEQKTGTKFQISTRIIGGQKVAKREDFAYQASIRYRGEHNCGGSIITSDHILTAAHCCLTQKGKDMSVKHVTVIVGELYVMLTDLSIVRKVDKITYHGGFRRHTLENDVAVMRLERSLLPWTKYVNKIPLPDEPLNVTNDLCVVSGWGHMEPTGNPSKTLKMLQIPIIPKSECISFYPSEIKEGMFCAGYVDGGRDCCQGDSGGPLVCNGTLYGIISWGKGCAQSLLPGIYADVYYYKSWILEKGLKGLRGCVEKINKNRYIYLLPIIIYLLI